MLPLVNRDILASQLIFLSLTFFTCNQVTLCCYPSLLAYEPIETRCRALRQPPLVHPSCHQNLFAQVSLRSRMQGVYSKQETRYNKGRNQPFSALDGIHNSEREVHGLRDRGSKESYQEVAGNLHVEEQKVRTFSKAKKKKDQVGAGWLKLGDPERFTGHLQRPSIYGRSQPS